MPVTLPFTPSRNNYRMLVPLHDRLYIFDVRWNSRDLAWYMDIREEDETLIVAGAKILIRSKIGRASNHAFFKTRGFDIRNISGADDDPRYDDLGSRVQIIITDARDVVVA